MRPPDFFIDGAPFSEGVRTESLELSGILSGVALERWEMGFLCGLLQVLSFSFID